MPVSVWHDLVDAHFPGRSWLPCSNVTLDALSAYKAAQALPTWDATLNALLAQAAPADDAVPDAADPDGPAQARQP